MFLKSPGSDLLLEHVEIPVPAMGEVLLRVEACGVCRTDWHLLAGELTAPALPLVLGHQIVGEVVAVGTSVSNMLLGQRLGVTWLGHTCGQCTYCHHEEENLCDGARFTGFDRWGGFAEYCVAEAAFCVPLPRDLTAVEAAPLLCGGVIGYRALRQCGEGMKLGLVGFGAAAHLVTQIAVYQKREVYAFTRKGDIERQQLARQLGACWSGSVETPPDQLLDAVIIFAADGTLVPRALQLVRKGGVVVCGGIHMSAIPSFPYANLWGERSLRSVANLTRGDATDLLALAARIPIHTQVTTYPLEAAGIALRDLNAGAFCGAAVVVL